MKHVTQMKGVLNRLIQLPGNRLALTRQLLQLGASRWVEENRSRPVTHEWRCAAIQTDDAGRRLAAAAPHLLAACRSSRREKRGISDIGL